MENFPTRLKNYGAKRPSSVPSTMSKAPTKPRASALQLETSKTMTPYFEKKSAAVISEECLMLSLGENALKWLMKHTLKTETCQVYKITRKALVQGPT